tara:strand:+ start:12039 stop:12191 length:153 start_codon:yes stop_codon:yes gene_type:complete
MEYVIGIMVAVQLITIYFLVLAWQAIIPTTKAVRWIFELVTSKRVGDEKD